jgi:AbrB family looped-hinge helix DNA binding protein
LGGGRSCGGSDRNLEVKSDVNLIEIDSNGRVLLPLGIRYRLDLNEGDKMAIDQLGDGTIILKKLAKELSFMRSNE